MTIWFNLLPAPISKAFVNISSLTVKSENSFPLTLDLSKLGSGSL